MELTPHVAGDGPFTVDYDVDYDPDGNYRFEGQVIAYGPANHSLDAELVEVLAPSGTKLASRTNPICDRPKVVLRNSGSTPLTSCTITFGLPDNLQSYTWTGELGFLEEEVVELVALDRLIVGWRRREDLAFVARVSAPNGGTDEVDWNNEVRSTFRRPPTYTYMEDPGMRTTTADCLCSHQQHALGEQCQADPPGRHGVFRADVSRGQHPIPGHHLPEPGVLHV